MKSNDYGKIYFIKQQSYKDKSFSPLQEINSNFDLLKSIELGTGRAIGITSNDELLEWNYEKKRTNLKKQEFPFLLSKPVYHFHKIKFGKVLMNKTMCLGLDVYGNVLVWGENKDGLLGLGYTITQIENPSKIECLKNINEIALSDNHAVAINASGEAFSWGTGKYGELGLEKSIYTPTPLRVNGTRSYMKVIVGNLITCFLDSEGHFSYFGVIIKILKGTFSTITVKNLLTDQNNSDPNTLFQEKIIDELETEPFVTVSIGNGFIALLSKKGMVYTLEYSDKLTLLYSKYFVYSLTVSNNQIIGLSYDKYNTNNNTSNMNNTQLLNDQTQINQQMYYLCQWVSKASDQEVSNEIWLTLIFKITEELHLDNIMLINTNNRNVILFLEKGMNLNTSVLFPNMNRNNNNDNTSHDISWDNITYNDIQLNSFGLMRKNTQNHNFLVFDSEYDDSYNMKFKRSELHQLPKNSSMHLNRTMLSEAKSSTNVLAYHKASSNTILGPLTERSSNKRLFSSDSSNKKMNQNDDEIVTMKEKELQDYQKEIDSIISNLKYRQKDKKVILNQKYSKEIKSSSNEYNSLFNTERKRHNTLPNSVNNKTSFENQIDNKKYIYNNLDTSNPNLETKNNMSDIEGLFNKTNNENTEIKNDAYSDAEELNLFNKSNPFDESNQLKMSNNYVYVNPNKSNFLSPQFIKTHKMSQLYSNKDSEGKVVGMNEEGIMKKIMSMSNAQRSNNHIANYKTKRERELLMYMQRGGGKLLYADPLLKVTDYKVHFNTEENKMSIEEKLNPIVNTNRTASKNNHQIEEPIIFRRALSNDGDVKQLASYYSQDYNNNTPLKGSSARKRKSPPNKSLSYGYQINHNLFSRNNQGKQIYNIDEEDRCYYLSNAGRQKFFIMTSFDEKENRPISDRTHSSALKNQFLNQDNNSYEANNNKMLKLNKHNAFIRKMEAKKISTIAHLENSSNFAYSNDDIFEETPKFDSRNPYYMSKEGKNKNMNSNMEVHSNQNQMYSSQKRDKKRDTKMKIDDLADDSGNNNYHNANEKYSQLGKNSNQYKNNAKQSNMLQEKENDKINLKLKEVNSGNYDGDNDNNDNEEEYQRNKQYNNQYYTNERNQGEFSNVNSNEINRKSNNKQSQFNINQNKQTSNLDNQSSDGNTLINQKKLKEESNVEYNQQLNEQDNNNLFFSFDPSVTKNPIIRNQPQEKDKDKKKMKDYDDIINEVKKDESFRKAFSTSGRVENSNSKVDFNSRDEDNDNASYDNIQNNKLKLQRGNNNNLAQSEEDLKQDLRLKKLENYENKQQKSNTLTKHKQFIDDNKKINEDEGSNDDNQEDNPEYNLQKTSKTCQRGKENKLNSILKDKNSGVDSNRKNNREMYNDKDNDDDDSFNINDDSENKNSLSRQEKNLKAKGQMKLQEQKRQYENNSNKYNSNNEYEDNDNNNDNEEGIEKRKKHINSPRKNEDYLMNLKKKQQQQHTEEESNSNENYYDQKVSGSTNVFKYPSKNIQINQNELIGSNNNNDNETARLGGKDDEDEVEQGEDRDKRQTASFQKNDLSNTKLKATKNYMNKHGTNLMNSGLLYQTEDYSDSTTKLLQMMKNKGQYQYEDNNLNDSENHNNNGNNNYNESNKTEFKQLLNQQKDYLMYQNNKNNKGDSFQGNHSLKEDKIMQQEKKMHQNSKKKPNEINTQNPYDEEYNKLKSKRISNKREHSPSENSSTEAKQQLRHLYKKNFGTKLIENPNIHHNRVSSMPITKNLLFNAEDTFGFNDSSDSKENFKANQESNMNKKKQRIGLGDEYCSEKKNKNPLLIKIPNDESIIDLPKKLNTEEDNNGDLSLRKNKGKSSDNKNNTSNQTDQKIFTLKGNSNENDSSLQGNKGNNYQHNEKINKISTIAPFIENKSMDIDDSGTKPGERIVQLLNKIKKEQNQIADSITQKDKFNKGDEDEDGDGNQDENEVNDSDSQGINTNKINTAHQHNDENVYTFSGKQTALQNNQNKTSGLQKNQRLHENLSENQNVNDTNTAKSEMINQKNKNVKSNSGNSNVNNNYNKNLNRKKQEQNQNQKHKLNRNINNQDEAQLSSEPSKASRDYDTQSSKGRDKKLRSKNEYITYLKKSGDNNIVSNQQRRKSNKKNDTETPSESEKGEEKISLISLVSESKSYRGKDDKNARNFVVKRQGGKLIVNKNFMNYFCYLIIDYMRKKAALSCIGNIYLYQIHKEKRFACKIIFRLMRKRIIFYEIKFYHRVRKIYKFLLNTQ